MKLLMVVLRKRESKKEPKQGRASCLTEGILDIILKEKYRRSGFLLEPKHSVLEAFFVAANQLMVYKDCSLPRESWVSTKTHLEICNLFRLNDDCF